jgi:spore cortex biosynthesis protein YabQ
MSYAITVEVQFFLISILCGALILLAYDALRIIRRLIRQNAILVAIQDILFWVAAGVFIFAMIYKENNGIIRGFCVMGMSIGMVLYHYILSSLLVNTITKIIQTLLKPLVMAINAFKRICRSILHRLERLINFVGKRLKNRMKSVKIAMSRKKQLTLAKRQKKAQQKAAERKKKEQLRLMKQKDKTSKTDSSKAATAVNDVKTPKEAAAATRTTASKGIPARKPRVDLRLKPDNRNVSNTADKLRKVH